MTTVAITGGVSGIGLALAKQFAKDGANIAIADKREDRLEEAVKTLEALGVKAAGFFCDVSDPNSVEAFADNAWEIFGSVDMVVNNAGTGGAMGKVVDVPLEDVRQVMNVNLMRVWHGCKIFGQRFIDQGTPAAIYNTGSENSLFNAVPMAAAYVASKHAVLALTEALRDEFPDFIKLGIIIPGWVRTEIGSPEQMAPGMDPDRFAAIIYEQIKAGEFYIVSHAYNMVGIEQRYADLSQAYAKYAPRHEGDIQYNVRNVLKLRATT